MRFLVAFPQGASVGGAVYTVRLPSVRRSTGAAALLVRERREAFVNAAECERLRRPAGLSCGGTDCAASGAWHWVCAGGGLPCLDRSDRRTPGRECLRANLTRDECEAGAHTLEDAAKAMMTTGAHPKGSVREIHVGGAQYRVAGIAQGIRHGRPQYGDDAGVSIHGCARWKRLRFSSMLRGGVDETFNAISIDSDTSTSDMILMFATGKSGYIRRPVDSDVGALVAGVNEAVHSILRDLALQVVRDGQRRVQAD
ncbi:MAG: bifunctional ornithine acetyltransferase/N-acetylglutamate synthase [Arhodomonas sp.]|nr:bifunctional ornithine acetyltransferase/N-acetylglutamate synthase [Arhodomonas sp.]